MNRICIFLGVFIMFFSNCEQKGGKKIGVIFANQVINRYHKERIYFEEKFKELGCEVIVTDGEDNPNIQEVQAMEMIDSGVDALILNAVNADKAAPIIRYAKSKGIVTVAYDRLIKNCELDLFCTFDGIKVGEGFAKYAVKRKPTGNYVLLNGERGDDNAFVFHQGTMNILQPLIDDKKINIVYNAYVDDWSGENAKHLMKEVLELTNQKIDAVIAQYDGLSGGAIAILNEKGMRGDIIVTGQDAEMTACNRILNGEQDMTIYKPVKVMAYDCAETVFKILNGDKIEVNAHVFNEKIDVPTRLYDPIAVDKNNLKETVVADGYLSLEEIQNAGN